MHHVVILAGGNGTRLWPASRQSLPKQLLPLVREGEPLIAATGVLARAIADDGRVVIVTTAEQADATRIAVPNVELIVEPASRNTAAAIALAGALIIARDPEAVITFLPADHHVRDPSGLAEALEVCRVAAKTTDAIALVGIPPTRPETGYGYLEMAAGPSDCVRRVLRFVEKPDAARAKAYLERGRYLWNAGIFCLTARRLEAELARHLPHTAYVASQIVWVDGQIRDPDGLYAQLMKVSFDHGVMEKTDHIVAVPAAVGWNDVGAWSALPEVRGTDSDDNMLAGTAVVLDGTGNIVMSDDSTLIATIGISDLVIIKSGDAILVVRKDQAQRVREIIEALQAKGLHRYV